MSPVRIAIGHLRIVMHGVAPAAAQTIAAGLEPALSARLTALRSVPSPTRITEMDLGSMEVPRSIDERAIIDAIALRLVDAIDALTDRVPPTTGGTS